MYSPYKIIFKVGLLQANVHSSKRTNSIKSDLTIIHVYHKIIG